MNFRELDAKVKLLRELRHTEAEIRSEIAAIEDSLKAAMLVRKTDILTGQNSVVTWKTIVTNRFDSKNFKLSYADLYQQYCKPVTSRRLVIS